VRFKNILLVPRKNLPHHYTTTTSTVKNLELDLLEKTLLNYLLVNLQRFAD